MQEDVGWKVIGSNRRFNSFFCFEILKVLLKPMTVLIKSSLLNELASQGIESFPSFLMFQCARSWIILACGHHLLRIRGNEGRTCHSPRAFSDLIVAESLGRPDNTMLNKKCVLVWRTYHWMSDGKVNLVTFSPCSKISLRPMSHIKQVKSQSWIILACCLTSGSS